MQRSGWSAMLRLVALAATSVAVTARCAASGGCLADGDCASGTYCTVANVCHVDCASDTDCAGGLTCDLSRGRCGGPTDAGADAGTGTDAVTDASGSDAAQDVVSADLPVGLDRAPAVDVTPGSDAPASDGAGVDGAAPDAPSSDAPTMDVPSSIDVASAVDVPPVTEAATSDAGPPGGYLDACTSDANCRSGHCLRTATGARYCTLSCAATSDCGTGFVCSLDTSTASLCVPDDTGLACTSGAGVSCARYCLANAEGGAAHCTRECSTGADCPGGFGCEDAPGRPGLRVCISVEQPCSANRDCTSDQCLSAGGITFCTAPCRSPADCPARMTVDDGTGTPTPLSPYLCQRVGTSTQTFCVPPVQAVATGIDYVAGNHPLGASCGTGMVNLCISDVCDPATSTCLQACTPASGCPAGFGCRPWVPDASGAVYLACQRAVLGSVAINGPCAHASDCATGLCLPTGTGSAYCTRYCPDRLCPTGMRCVPDGTAFDGTPLSLCMR